VLAQRQGLLNLGGSLDALGVIASIQCRSNLETRIRGGRANEFEELLVGFERLTMPVGADTAEEAVLDGIPF
jgi:hypothetical protein